MAVHRLKAVQKIPADVQNVWAFFSDPANLPRITPAAMDFRIISAPYQGSIYPGQIIEYKVRPLWNLSMYWMTEITQVRPLEFFIDEQRKGPYSLWHHQHHFRMVDGGVEMTDLVHYSAPFGFIGDIANSLIVRQNLANLFRYRAGKVEEYFGKWEAGGLWSLQIPY